MPPLGSPDYKPDDLEYQALRAQAQNTLEVFSQFLPSAVTPEMARSVDSVFCELRWYGEKAGLLSPPLIRAIAGYLDAYKKAHGELSWDLQFNEEWIMTLFRNLKPNDSVQVLSLPCCSYGLALISILTLFQSSSTAAVVDSVSANAHDLDDSTVNSASAEPDTAPKYAFDAIPSIQSASSAGPQGFRPEVSPLTTPSITPILEHLSVEHTQSVLRSEDTPLCSEYTGPARADPDEVSETPALVVSGRTSNDTNPQETELLSTEVSLVPLATDEPFFAT